MDSVWLVSPQNPFIEFGTCEQAALRQAGQSKPPIQMNIGIVVEAMHEGRHVNSQLRQKGGFNYTSEHLATRAQAPLYKLIQSKNAVWQAK